LSAVLIFSIGPVQSFLAQARKAQDLFAGSYLLSHLCRKAAEIANKRYDAEIVYPDLGNPSLPNRFVAVLPDGLKLAEVGATLEETVREEFQRLGEEVLKKACGSLPPDPRLKEAFFRQLGTFPEINWVAVTMEDGDYTEAFRHAESYLEAAKTVRAFTPLNEQGRKCGLTGEHNALFFRERRAYLCQEAWEVPENILHLRYLARGESLGALGMVKRCLGLVLPSVPGFPSVAAVALMATLNSLPPDMLKNYQNLFGDRFDEQLYYEENLSPRAFEREGIPLSVLDKARGMRTEIEEEAKQRGLQLTKYYAVLCMDADWMGKWVGGSFLPERANLQEFQKSLTKALGRYAQWVHNFIVHPKGRIVYCGGDDILALLNLNYLVPVLEKLRSKFPQYERLGPVQPGKHSTTSCGICIAHYKEPLSEVLEHARKAESTAKDKGGRDAFCLWVLKRSGEPHQVVYKWAYGDLRPLELLGDLVGLLAAGRVSSAFVRAMTAEFASLRRIAPGEKPPPSLDPIVNAELHRRLRRSWQGDAAKEIKRISDLAGKLAKLFAQGTLDNFLSFLEIAAFLAREVNQELCA
jgi:CRISPR-associated protein Cmr2